MTAMSEPDVVAVEQRPLVVDLDGTLIRTDLLVEAFFILLKQQPWTLFWIPFWLLRGRAYLKRQISERATIEPETLPYQETFLDYLRAERARGRVLVLATAEPLAFAQPIADYLQLFSLVLASEGKINLAGVHKGERLLAEFGQQGFDYAGNARPDLAIWAHARQAILVNPWPGIAPAAAALAPVAQVFADRPPLWRALPRALRLHQWLKNLLVLVPLVTAHLLLQPDLLMQALLAFVAFGLCASSVYVLNDLLDLTADRHHPRKRRRPFAAGDVPIILGLLIIPILLAAAAGLALLLPPAFLGILALYYATTLTYSLHLKQLVLLDVLILAGLYTLRIIAGAAAIGIWPSFWLLAFSMFLFLSLAIVKRYTELLELRGRGGEQPRGRGYVVGDLAMLAALGGASGYLAVLVLALYINSDSVRELYRQPETIWLLCPILLYWISRIWLITHRGAMHDDPILFAARDRVSYGLLVGCALALGFAL